MLFSIVVPVYNVEKYLPQCLDSIVGQCGNSEDVEILLIDDGSTDQSGGICDDYGKKYHNISVYHNSNHGLMYTRRFGYARATGEYILNCDSDDYLQQNMIVLLRNAIQDMAADIYLFNMNTDNAGKIDVMAEHIFTEQDKKMFYVNMNSVRARFVSSTDIVSLCTKIYKRACINLSRDYSEYLAISNGEDTLQSIEIYTNAKDAVYIDEALYNYRIGSGMTHYFDEDYFHSFETIFRVMKIADAKWKLDDFNILIAERLFNTLGRSVTQMRYAEDFGIILVYHFCRQLLENDFVREYMPMYRSVRGKLSPCYYKILLNLLFAKQFWAIVVLLKVKNITGK